MNSAAAAASSGLTENRLKATCSILRRRRRSATYDEDDDANADATEAARSAWETFAAPHLGLFASDPIVESFGPGTLAFQRQWRDVDAVNALLGCLRDSAAGSADVASVAPTFLEDAMRFSFDLDEFQRAAVQRAASSRFVVITGGPGTGKTTIVCAILRALLSSGTLRADQIALAASTGRAAQRMGEAIIKECGKAVGLDDGSLGVLEIPGTPGLRNSETPRSESNPATPAPALAFFKFPCFPAHFPLR